MKKVDSGKEGIMRHILVLCIVLIVGCGSLKIQGPEQQTQPLNNDIAESQKLLGEVLEKLREQYYQEIDVKKWTLETLREGIKRLDPHGALTTKETLKEIEANSKSRYEMITLENGFSYISISDFELGMSEKLESFLVAIPRTTPIIIDLRGNVGGFISECINALSFFVKQDTVLFYERTRTEPLTLKSSYYQTTARHTNPLVILEDDETGSAGELFALALQGIRRAIVIGQQTEGLGTLLLTFDIWNDAVKIAIPYSEYFDVNLQSINKKGISPTIVVEATNPARRYVPGAPDSILAKALEVLTIEARKEARNAD